MAIEQKDATKEQVKMINRGMKAIADIAKIYRKYGNSARFVPIAPTDSTPRQRMRLNRQAAVPTGLSACGTCHKPFIAKSNERCQCKAATKTKRHSR